MKTKLGLAIVVALAVVSLAGCADEEGREPNAVDEAYVAAAPGNLDEYGQMLEGRYGPAARASGPRDVTIPDFDWVVDLADRPILQTSGPLKVSFDASSALKFRTPRLTVDHTFGPSSYGTTRLNHLDVQFEAGLDVSIGAVIESAEDATFDTGEGGFIPDPTITIPVYDGPTPVSVFGVLVPFVTTIEVELGCHVETAFKGRITAGAQYSAFVHKGVEYNRYARYSKDPSLNGQIGPDRWSADFDASDRLLYGMERFHVFPDVTRFDRAPRFRGEVRAQAAALAKCWAEPRIAVSLGKVIGGSIAVRPFAVAGLGAKADSTMPDSPSYVKYSLGWGIEGGAYGWVDLPLLRPFETPTYTWLKLGSDVPLTGKIDL